MNTTTTVTLPGPAKAAGWCKEQGVEHSWKEGQVLTMSPPIATRRCVNCGQRQFHRPGYWEDQDG